VGDVNLEAGATREPVVTPVFIRFANGRQIQAPSGKGVGKGVCCAGWVPYDDRWYVLAYSVKVAL
jgi:hypothetical protein